jgi:hypothetical protein
VFGDGFPLRWREFLHASGCAEFSKGHGCGIFLALLHGFMLPYATVSIKEESWKLLPEFAVKQKRAAPMVAPSTRR